MSLMRSVWLRPEAVTEAASITHIVVTGRWAGTLTLTCGIHISVDLTSAFSWGDQDKGVKVTEEGAWAMWSMLGCMLHQQVYVDSPFLFILINENLSKNK